MRHYFCAGTLEEWARSETSRCAAAARAAGCPVVHRERIAGHDSLSWQEELPAALAWCLGR